MKPLSVEMACLLGIQSKIQAVCPILHSLLSDIDYLKESGYERLM